MLMRGAGRCVALAAERPLCGPWRAWFIHVVPVLADWPTVGGASNGIMEDTRR